MELVEFYKQNVPLLADILANYNKADQYNLIKYLSVVGLGNVLDTHSPQSWAQAQKNGTFNHIFQDSAKKLAQQVAESKMKNKHNQNKQNNSEYNRDYDPSPIERYIPQQYQNGAEEELEDALELLNQPSVPQNYRKPQYANFQNEHQPDYMNNQSNNEFNHRNPYNQNNSQAQSLEQNHLENEIQYLKQKLDGLNRQIDYQSTISNKQKLSDGFNPNNIPPNPLEDDQYIRQQRVRSSQRKKYKSPSAKNDITSKITQSPPPDLNEIMRSKSPNKKNLPHLDDKQIKSILHQEQAKNNAHFKATSPKNKFSENTNSKKGIQGVNQSNQISNIKGYKSPPSQRQSDRDLLIVQQKLFSSDAFNYPQYQGTGNNNYYNNNQSIQNLGMGRGYNQQQQPYGNVIHIRNENQQSISKQQSLSQAKSSSAIWNSKNRLNSPQNSNMKKNSPLSKVSSPNSHQRQKDYYQRVAHRQREEQKVFQIPKKLRNVSSKIKDRLQKDKELYRSRGDKKQNFEEFQQSSNQNEWNDPQENQNTDLQYQNSDEPIEYIRNSNDEKPKHPQNNSSQYSNNQVYQNNQQIQQNPHYKQQQQPNIVQSQNMPVQYNQYNYDPTQQTNQRHLGSTETYPNNELVQYLSVDSRQTQSHDFDIQQLQYQQQQQLLLQQQQQQQQLLLQQQQQYQQYQQQNKKGVKNNGSPSIQQSTNNLQDSRGIFLQMQMQQQQQLQQQIQQQQQQQNQYYLQNSQENPNTFSLQQSPQQQSFQQQLQQQSLQQQQYYQMQQQSLYQSQPQFNNNNNNLIDSQLQSPLEQNQKGRLLNEQNNQDQQGSMQFSYNNYNQEGGQQQLLNQGYIPQSEYNTFNSNPSKSGKQQNQQQNIVELANSFLSSPIIKHLTSDQNLFASAAIPQNMYAHNNPYLNSSNTLFTSQNNNPKLSKIFPDSNSNIIQQGSMGSNYNMNPQQNQYSPSPGYDQKQSQVIGSNSIYIQNQALGMNPQIQNNYHNMNNSQNTDNNSSGNNILQSNNENLAVSWVKGSSSSHSNNPNNILNPSAVYASNKHGNYPQKGISITSNPLVGSQLTISKNTDNHQLGNSNEGDDIQNIASPQFMNNNPIEKNVNTFGDQDDEKNITQEKINSYRIYDDKKNFLNSGLSDVDNQKENTFFSPNREIPSILGNNSIKSQQPQKNQNNIIDQEQEVQSEEEDEEEGKYEMKRQTQNGFMQQSDQQTAQFREKGEYEDEEYDETQQVKKSSPQNQIISSSSEDINELKDNVHDLDHNQANEQLPEEEEINQDQQVEQGNDEEEGDDDNNQENDHENNAYNDEEDEQNNLDDNQDEDEEQYNEQNQNEDDDIQEDEGDNQNEDEEEDQEVVDAEDNDEDDNELQEEGEDNQDNNEEQEDENEDEEEGNEDDNQEQQNEDEQSDQDNE